MTANDANESTQRLVKDGMSMGLTNMYTAREFSVLYHVFARKQCTICCALRNQSYLTLITPAGISPRARNPEKAS